MRPVRIPGRCDSCLGKEMQVRRAGNYCDHCQANAMNTLIYINRKTKKRYCTDCRGLFRNSLVSKGFEAEEATKIMIQDFALVNDPMRKARVHKK